jgi:hypothetical protein
MTKDRMRIERCTAHIIESIELKDLSVQTFRPTCRSYFCSFVLRSWYHNSVNLYCETDSNISVHLYCEIDSNIPVHLYRAADSNIPVHLYCEVIVIFLFTCTVKLVAIFHPTCCPAPVSAQAVTAQGSALCPVTWYCTWHHVTRHNTPIHNILSTAPQLNISQKALGTLLEDDNFIPKHVGATIHN